jgi:regulator of replication initiation timing
MNRDNIDDAQATLAALRAENARLRAENQHLRTANPRTCHHGMCRNGRCVTCGARV